jgi:hypothetical protein
MTTELQPPSSADTTRFETCEHCEAPVEATQRYCVVCGTRRRHVQDPAARFISQATARSRTAARSASASPARTRRRGPGLGAALALAVIPAAVGVGVVVGRSSVNTDGKLLAALRAQRPEVVNVGGGAGSAAAVGTTQQVATLNSDFPLQSGYSVELSTLSGSSHQAAVNAAEKVAEAKGATHVGLVTQTDYTITPKPKAGADVIYSGADKTKAEAEHALAKLKAKFPHAEVIALSSTSASSTAGTGKVLAKTHFGTATQVTGFKATKASLAQGAQVANKVAKTIGKSYVGAQTGLPSQVSVP